MMARRLRPRAERTAAGEGKSEDAAADAAAGEGAGAVAGAGAGASKAAGATAAASRPLMRETRPEVMASGKRAAFIRVIEETKAAQAAKEKVCSRPWPAARRPMARRGLLAIPRYPDLVAHYSCERSTAGLRGDGMARGA